MIDLPIQMVDLLERYGQQLARRAKPLMAVEAAISQLVNELIGRRCNSRRQEAVAMRPSTRRSGRPTRRA
jgi:hypothetical protein